MARSEALARAERVYIDGFPDASNASVDVLREQFDAMLLQFPLPDDATVAEIDAGGVPALSVSAPTARPDRVLVWFHGGGYVLGSPKGYQEMACAMSRATGRPVVVPDYRLAPENKFPAAVHDAISVVSWATETYGGSATVVGGDSAGGGMTFAVLASLRDRGGAGQPAAAVAVSPLADFAMAGESITANAETDPAVSKGSVSNLAAAYLQGHDPTDPLASPIYGDLSGLPPALIMVGSTETLLDDSRRLVDGVTAAGGVAELSVYEDMCHVWTLFSSFLPEGETGIEQIAAFVRAHE